MPSKDFMREVNDSKKLSEKKREELYSKLIELSQTPPPAKAGIPLDEREQK